nr:DUF2264 domain-containing protein [Zhihengliuella flava]
MPLPAPDWQLSPHTGYTREHWEAAADGLLAAQWRFASAESARLDLPGSASGSGPESDGLEGFARSMLIAAFRVAGARGEDPHGWLRRYARGLAAGTQAGGPEQWPPIRDHDDGGQPLVESASIALSLRITRPWLWDTLEPETRHNVVSWLRGALTVVPAPNNWYLFASTVAGFLESIGEADEATSAARKRASLLLEHWYCGDGWYTDGDGRAFDHYNGWALHLYPVLGDLLDGTEHGYGARLETFLGGFGYWFGSDGAPLYMGRSMTYRFAAATAVGLGALTGNTPWTPGQSRRLLSGALKYFLDRGAVTEQGLLSLGWHGPHAASVQGYSGPASPLWAAKAFVCLLAPADAELWTATESPAPVEEADRVVATPATGLLVQSTARDGLARLHNHGSDKVRPPAGVPVSGSDPLYARLAYSTASGPTAGSNPADNHVGVLWRGRRSVRRQIHPLGCADHGRWGWAGSWHRPVFTASSPAMPGLRIESYVVVHGNAEVRIDRVVGPLFPVRVEHSGWAVGDGGPISELEPLAGWEKAETVTAPAGTAFADYARLPRLSAAIDESTTLVAVARLRSPDVEPTPVGDVVVAGEVVRCTFEPAEGPRLALEVDLSAGEVREVDA